MDWGIQGTSPGWVNNFFSSQKYPHWLWGPPSLIFSGYFGRFAPHRVKCQGHEVDHSPPPKPGVQNECSYTPNPLICLQEDQQLLTFMFTVVTLKICTAAKFVFTDSFVHIVSACL